MPATSKKQQRLMGMAYAYAKGEAENVPEEAKRIAKTMKKDDLKHFAATKHEGLPEKKEAVQLYRPRNPMQPLRFRLMGPDWKPRKATWPEQKAQKPGKQDPAEVIQNAAGQGRVLLSRNGELKAAGFGQLAAVPLALALEGGKKLVSTTAEGLRNVAQHGPVPAALAYGALGAGLGYGTGKLINKVTGRKTKSPGALALGAGLAAAAIPAFAAASSKFHYGRWNYAPLQQKIHLRPVVKSNSVTEKASSFFGRNPVGISYTRGQVMADPNLSPFEKAKVVGILEKADPDGMGMADPPSLAGAAFNSGLGFAAGTAFARIMSGMFGGLSESTQKTMQSAGVIAGLLRETGVLR